jgi:signal transduction histidine kinase
LWLSNQLSTLRTTEKKFELHHFFGDSPYPDISVLKLYTDRHNMLWIATNAGVYMYDPSVQFFSTHLLTNGIPYTTQGVSLLSHPEGYWMGGENFNSLVFCDLQHNIKKNYSALLHDHVAVLNIMQDLQGRLWLSTNKGIYISDAAVTKFMHWSEQSAGTERLPRDFVNSVFHTSDSSVWIFPWRMGIWKMNQQQRFEPLQSRKHDTLLQNSNIARAVEDTLGHIWLADYDHGFHRYDKETGEVTTLIRDVCFSNIYLLHNKIWLASSHALIETDIRNSSMRFYPFPEGKDKFTFNFIPDQHHGMWIATKTGLLYFNIQSKSYRCFTVSDGLYSNYLDVSFAQLSNGKIMMAGSTFVTTFDPEKLNATDPAPALLLTEIRSNKHFIKISDHNFQTPWNENSLNFSWAFLNYKNPLGNEYFYKMDGVDADWISAGNSGKAFYNNLQPGSYTFHYKARSSDYRLESEQTISFRVKPPYWQTWWFRIMMLLCTGFIFYRFIRYISQKNLKEKIMLLEKKQAIERERNRISRDMHDELGSGLTKIAILSEVMKKAPDERNAVIDKISDTARSLVGNLDEMVWSLNPHNDTLQQLIAYVSEHGVQFFENTEIDFDQVIPDEIPQHILQEEKRRALFLCIKEFFNNTLKHSKARRVMITWSFTDQYFYCILTDDGIGFDIHNADKSRSGLRNMESRMREIKAGFELHSDDAGTMLRIEWPF